MLVPSPRSFAIRSRVVRAEWQRCVFRPTAILLGFSLFLYTILLGIGTSGPQAVFAEETTPPAAAATPPAASKPTPEAKSEPKSEPAPKPKAETKSEPAPQPAPEPAPEAKPEPAPKPAPEKTPEQPPKPAPEAKPAPKPAPAPAKKAEPAPTPVAPEATPAKAPTPEAKSEPEKPEKKEPKLRFSFRFQRWVDVLEWVAEQSDLSLVLDAPPPGTFNYSDSREYTPTEAIDLLNGVLITKGYTLIRRERMLVLINLADGLPEGLVQRVTIDELAKRGRFEMVSVLIPLEGRNVEEVHAEITPLLSPYGKSVPMPKTNQLLVTDTAGIMKTLKATIDAIPEAGKRARPTNGEKTHKKAPEPALVFQTHPITSADPEVVMQVIKALLPEGKVVFDPQMRQVNAYLSAPHQELVKSVLAKMQSEDAADKKPSLQSYHLSVGTGLKSYRRGEQLKEGLATIVPEAKMTFDPRTGKLVAWASPQDHETLKQAVSQMGGRTNGDQADLRTFALRRGTEAKAAVATLAELLPEVEMHYNAASGKLVTIVEQKTADLIEKTLTSLQVLIDQPLEAGQSQQIRYYAVPAGATVTLVDALREVAPGARATLDSTGKRIMVVGTEADHKAVTESLQTIRESAKPLERQFKSYAIDQLDSSQVTTTLRQAVPDATASIDPRTGRLLVLADPDGHQKITEVLVALSEDRTPRSTRQLEIHKTTDSDLKTTVSVLKQIVPDAQITSDAASSSLIVFAVPADQELIRSTLVQLSQKASVEQNTLATYQVTPNQEKRFLALVPSLKTDLPGVRVLPDDDPETLAIWATPEEHAALKQMIAVLDIESTSSQRVFAAYPFRTANSTQTLSMIASLCPGAKVVYDERSRRLAVWATAEEHETIRSMVQQMSVGSNATSGDATGGSSAETMAVYSTKGATPTTIQQVLDEIAPAARSTVNVKGQSAIVWATEAEHQEIRKAIDQLRQAADDPDKPIVKSYSAGSSDATTLSTQMQRMFYRAKFLPNATDNTIKVYATPDEQQEIAAIFQNGQTEGQPDNPMELVAYKLKDAKSTTVIAALRQQVPTAKATSGVNTDEVLVWARKEDHKTIKKTIDVLNAGAEDRAKNAPYPVPYRLEGVTAATATRLLYRSFPTATFSTGSDTYQLIAVATPELHEQIKKAVQHLTEATDQKDAKLVVYSTGDLSSYTVTGMIRQVLPQLKPINGPKPNEVSVWATDEEHKKIKETVDMLIAGGEDRAKNSPYPAPYRLEGVTAATATRLLYRSFPTATFSTGSDTYQLIAVATPELHEQIKKAVQHLTEATDKKDAKLVVYSTGDLSSYTVTGMIRQVLPQLIPINGPKTNEVSVWATDEEHKKIKETVDMLVAGGEDRAKNVPYPVPYRLEGVTATTATRMLYRSFPTATFSPGSDTYQLIVVATPKLHEQIKTAVQHLKEATDKSKDSKLVVYNTGDLSSYSVTGTIRQILPHLKPISGPKTDEVSLWATDEEHKTVRQMIDTMVGSEDSQAKMVLYETKRLTYKVAVGAIRAKFPRVSVTQGLNANQMAIWATPDEHTQIKTILDTLDASESPETAPTAIVYSLENIKASPAITVLRSAFPQVAMSQGADPYKLVAVARPEDHELLGKAIEQMIKAPSEAEQVKPVVYPFSSSVNRELVTVLRQTFSRATFAIGANQRSLIAWAREADHGKIKEMVRQLDSPEPLENSPKAQVFKLKKTAARSVIQILSPMYKDATFSTGQTPTELLVMARPEDMKRIETAITEMVTTDDPQDKPTMKAHPLETADSAKLYQMLRSFYYTRSDVQVSLDAKNNMIVAIARQEDHAQIDEMIHQIESGATPESVRTVKGYSVENVDTSSLMKVLNTLLESQRQTVSLSVDPQNQRLLAIARQKQHEVIAKAIEDMRGESRKLEILNFEEVNPETAMLAIEKNFVDQNGLPTADAPTVDLDEQSDQLFVRATAKQHKEIRELLVRIGETSMGSADASNTRTVPFSQDVQSVLQRVQEVWSKTEKNPLQIGEPSAEKKTPEKEAEPPKSEAKTARLWGAQLLTTAAETPIKVETPVVPQAPVYLIPGDKSITVKSDDPEALARMEKLLRSMSSVKSIGGKDFQVFMLKYTDAEQLVPKLEDMAWQMAGPNWWQSKHAVIMSDRRLNAVIVQGSRKDRELISQLIEFLDTNDFPKELPFNEPTILPIANTNASEIEDIIYGVFSDRLARRGRGGYGSWWNTNTAKVVAEETSNSLVIIAQEPLRTQIIEMAKKLDVAANAETASTVKLIQLKNLNASTARQLLNATQKRSPSRRTSRRR